MRGSIFCQQCNVLLNRAIFHRHYGCGSCTTGILVIENAKMHLGEPSEQKQIYYTSLLELRFWGLGLGVWDLDYELWDLKRGF